MRRSQDLPVDRPRRRFTGRGILIALGGLFMFVLVFGRAIARFYVDYLWHDALDRGDVFWGVIGAKFTLFAMFFGFFAVLACVNLFVADRTAPTSFPANVHPYVERFHEVFGKRLRLARYASALILGVLIALPAVAQWQQWLLFQNSKSFGSPDPQFGADVGFYVFQLPFLSFVLDWMYAAVIIVLLFSAAAHILNGGVVFASPAPVIRSATKAHMAVLLAILAVLKAGDYWLDRYELTNSTRGIVDGATYSVVNAQIPAIMLLILIALLTAGLYLSVIKTNSWRLPFLASALWLIVSIVGGVIYPAIVQSLVVDPNQETREAPFIERNVDATREALGLTDIGIREVQYGTLTAAEVEADIEPLTNVRLLNPAEMETRFLVDEGEVAGLSIEDLDVDRYELDGKVEEVLVAARELDLGGVTNRSWQGIHLINTRGCGLVAAPTSKVQSNQRPDYRTLELDRPELYFSPTLSGYGIANTASSERECDEPHQYEGDRGVAMSSFARRAAFALAFLDYNVVGSGAIQPDSQMLWVRNVNDRLNKLAPFLSYDSDPYPVAVDGRAVWVVDGYTTSSRFPYAQSIGAVQRSTQSGLSNSDNYVRNSVKVVVDAYTGDVTFYIVDDEDPILKAWQSAFPDLFTPGDEMPRLIREHLRYPEDLFRIQTDIYSKYRLDPALFFQRDGNAWSVAQAPSVTPANNTRSITTEDNTAAPSAAANTFATESNAERFTPYYTVFDTSQPGEERKEEFVILRPFVPFSTGDTRTQLQAYMTASSDPDTYGQLTTYVVQERNGRLPDGPLRVAGNAESQSEISDRITLDNQDAGGTKVRFGDLQLVPVGDGLIWVRPYYVAVPQETGTVRSVSEFRFVIVSNGNNSVLASTITEGVRRLFPGFEGDVGDVLGAPTELSDGGAVTPVEDDGIDVSGLPVDAAELLTLADSLFQEADDALAVGSLGEYQAKIEEARARLADALAILEAG